MLVLDRSTSALHYILDISNPALLQPLSDGTTVVDMELLDVRMGSGEDTVVGGILSDMIDGGGSADTLIGAGGNDTLRGGAGEDTLQGGDGNDDLGNTSGADDFMGGADTDKATLQLSSAAVNLTLDLTNPGTLHLLGDGTTLIDVEMIDFTGGSGADNILAGALADTLRGGFGNDTLRGAGADDIVQGDAGNDIIDGGIGNDAMAGGAGNDTFTVNSVGDVVTEVGGGGLDTLTTSVSYVLAATSHVDVVQTDNPAATVLFNLTGSSIANTLRGNAGKNILDGKAGGDTLQGFGGNDTFRVDNAGDKVLEVAGGGNDTVLATATFALTANADVQTLQAANAAAINLTGSNVANKIIGNGAKNTLDGKAGADIMQGLGGNDTYFVSQATDKVIEAANRGTDKVNSAVTLTLAAHVEELTLIGAAVNGTGNTLNNAIIGNARANTLTGLAGADKLNGGAANDVVIGGLGKDIMSGGAGRDRFDFNSVGEIGKGATRDVITDFVHLSDRMDLATIDANGGAPGHAFAFLAGNGTAFTGAAGQLRWFQQNLAGTANDRTIVEGDINGNKVADFQIQLSGLKTLTAGDFFL